MFGHVFRKKTPEELKAELNALIEAQERDNKEIREFFKNINIEDNYSNMCFDDIDDSNDPIFDIGFSSEPFNIFYTDDDGWFNIF